MQDFLAFHRDRRRSIGGICPGQCGGGLRISAELHACCYVFSLSLRLCSPPVRGRGSLMEPLSSPCPPSTHRWDDPSQRPPTRGPNFLLQKPKRVFLHSQTSRIMKRGPWKSYRGPKAQTSGAELAAAAPPRKPASSRTAEGARGCGGSSKTCAGELQKK